MIDAPLIARACCTAPDAPGVRLAKADDPPPPMTGPIIGEREPFTIDRALAYHEAAHALANVALGGTVEYASLTAAHPHERGTLTGPEARAVWYAAGPAGEKLARGWLFPEPEPEVLDTYRRVRACVFGGCDQCMGMASCVANGGFHDQALAVRRYRRAETTALAMVTSEPGRRFLRLAAHELLADGEVKGQFFHDLARDVLPPNFMSTLELENSNV